MWEHLWRPINLKSKIQNTLMHPFLLYSDGKGNIFEDFSLYVVGRSGWDAMPVPEDEWIELPEGGQLYELPGRRGIGIDVKTGEMRIYLYDTKLSVFFTNCLHIA